MVHLHYYNRVHTHRSDFFSRVPTLSWSWGWTSGHRPAEFNISDVPFAKPHSPKPLWMNHCISRTELVTCSASVRAPDRGINGSYEPWKTLASACRVVLRRD